MTYFRHGTTQLLTAVSVNIRLYGPDLVIFTAAFCLGEYDRSGPYNLILTSTEVNNCLILHEVPGYNYYVIWLAEISLPRYKNNHSCFVNNFIMITMKRQCSLTNNLKTNNAVIGL